MTTAATLATADLHAPVVDAVLHAAAEMVAMEVVFLGSFTDSDYDFLRVVGEIPGLGEGDRRPSSSTICEAMLCGAPPFTSDAGSVAEYASLDVVADYGVTSYIGVPVIVHGEIVGTLCGIDRSTVAVGPDALQLMHALSAVIAAHVETGTVLRRSASGWQVGTTDDLDLTSAMSLADLLA
jgi:GAF domain-containing protein